jgi:hypothetical protein
LRIKLDQFERIDRIDGGNRLKWRDECGFCLRRDIERKTGGSDRGSGFLFLFSIRWKG